LGDLSGPLRAHRDVVSGHHMVLEAGPDKIAGRLLSAFALY
jgi:hypothetical protein